jgi:hypothetical protein
MGDHYMIPLVGYPCFKIINQWEETMIIEKYSEHAAAEYQCNVNEFISTGEGRKLTRLKNLQIRTKYPEVGQWYQHLDEAGRERVHRFLIKNYGE